jgi:hypothetical protein
MSMIKGSGIIRIDAARLHHHQSRIGVRPLERLLAAVGRASIEHQQIRKLPASFVAQVQEALELISRANYGTIVGRERKPDPVVRYVGKGSGKKGDERRPLSKVLENMFSIRGWGINNGDAVYGGSEERSGSMRPRLGWLKAGVAKPVRNRPGVVLAKERNIAWEFHRTIVNDGETLLLIPMNGLGEPDVRPGETGRG